MTRRGLEKNPVKVNLGRLKFALAIPRLFQVLTPPLGTGTRAAHYHYHLDTRARRWPKTRRKIHALRAMLQTAGQRGVVALAGVDLLPHDDAYETHVRTQALSRLTASVLVPAKGAWGGSLWRLDASFADSLPQEMNLGDPRAFALALVTHNAMEEICGQQLQLVEDAEHFGGVKATWETPYELHVSRTVTMLCADFVARDPQNEITALAQTVQFVGRE